jgi:heme-degrading monooxygenase HmoA
MDEVKWASGRWHVKDSQVDEFIQRWKDWLSWTNETCPGFRSATLLQDEHDAHIFTSFSDWDDDASRQGWMSSDGFSEKFAPLRALCDEVQTGSFRTAASWRR